jgi:hypothetical protein
VPGRLIEPQALAGFFLDEEETSGALDDGRDGDRRTDDFFHDSQSLY